MLKKDYPELAKLWNYERNDKDGLFFKDVSSGSGKKAWWICKKGHEWQASICNVVGKGSGCPYCSGRKAVIGVNDLATLNPQLANEWNYEKNGNLSPQNFTLHSGKRVWWRCINGHEWESAIHTRSTGVGCPYCAGRKVLKGFNDLATTHPNLLDEWNYDKNDDVTPFEVSFGSEKQVWWRCKNGHEWQAMVGDRTRGRGCPYCSNRRILNGVNTIDATNPEITTMWDYKKNGGLKPSDVTIGSGRIIWWKCNKGHSWQAAPYNISKGQGCPYCANKQVLKGFNDLETINPKIADEWDYEKNGDLKPSDVIAGSTRSVWWRCKKGHEWQARIYSRNDNHSCPFCNLYKVTSIPEKAIVYYLRRANVQVEENKLIDGKKEVDVFLPERKIAIEYDGQHWHMDKKRDNEKNKICKGLNITLLRVREPGLPKLNDLSKNYIIEKTNDDYSYLKPAITWIFDQLSIEEPDINIPRDIQGIYDLYNQSTDVDSVKNIPSIAEEWDYEKNTINIESVSKGSKLKVWWKCKRCGYSYERTVQNKYVNGKCPKCASTKLIIGYNDLATTRKDLLKWWNYKRNKTITPIDVTAGSNKKVWWKCEKGHEWEATVKNVSRGTRCPYCAGKKGVK